MQTPATWYELLGHLVDTPQAKQRLANQLNVSVVTITRWIAHTSTPRSTTLRAILNAFPQHRKDFLLLFARDNIAWQDEDAEVAEQDEEIPSANFYRHLLSIYRLISPALRSVTIQQLILTDALTYLDPHQLGISCAVLLCLPPFGTDPVRSLYLADGKGTSPWPQDLRSVASLLGAESLAGSVTTSGRAYLLDREESSTHIAPSRWVLHERSTLAAPIMRGSQVAGCFLVSSTQPGAVLNNQFERVVCYADLLTLTIETDQWYNHERICLQILPSKEVQQQFFAHLSQKVMACMMREHLCTYAEARLRTMQEIENALLQSEDLPSTSPLKFRARL